MRHLKKNPSQITPKNRKFNIKKKFIPSEELGSPHASLRFRYERNNSDEVQSRINYTKQRKKITPAAKSNQSNTEAGKRRAQQMNRISIQFISASLTSLSSYIFFIIVLKPYRYNLAENFYVPTLFRVFINAPASQIKELNELLMNSEWFAF